VCVPRVVGAVTRLHREDGNLDRQRPVNCRAIMETDFRWTRTVGVTERLRFYVTCSLWPKPREVHKRKHQQGGCGPTKEHGDGLVGRTDRL